MALIRQDNANGMICVDTSPGITVSSANPANEITLFSQVIPGMVMGNTGKIIKFTSISSLSTPVVAPTITIRARFGAASVSLVTGIALLGSLSTAKPFIIEGYIINVTAATQYVFAQINQTGSGPLILGGTTGSVDADWTVNTTADQTFSLTAQFGSVLTGSLLTTKFTKLELS